MSQNPANFGFEGESREMTVLFSDVRSFTTISEGLPAARLKEMLNRFFTPMTEIIFRNRGTIDKYVGDMVMAFWGAPVKDDDHAYHAVLTAMEMIRETGRLKPDFKRQGFPEINIGIGINTGLMNVGDMGSTYRRAYTVIGDAVNLASRLEGATKLYGASIIVGESVYEKTADRILYRELDLIRVKGKQQAVYIYQPVCLRSQARDEDNHEMEMWQKAIALYRQARWHEAHTAFEILHATSAAKTLAELYLERIASLTDTVLAEDWDGVYESANK
jgi:adenylate cyclase